MHSPDAPLPAPGKDLNIREARQNEIPRAASLFGSFRFPERPSFLVAVRSRPVEHIVAALGWWAAGTSAKFALARLPGAEAATVAGPLARAFEAQAATIGSLRRIEYASPLAEGEDWARNLATAGYAADRTERLFETPYAIIWRRVTELKTRYRARFPADWRTGSIRHHEPEIAWPLIRPHRLMAPEEFRHSWFALPSEGFDADLSSILFAGRRPIGALLVRVRKECISVDVRAVNLESPRLRGLGNIALLGHIANQTEAEGKLRTAAFRADDVEHRETANIAFRIGGREVGRRHVYAKGIEIDSPA